MTERTPGKKKLALAALAAGVSAALAAPATAAVVFTENFEGQTVGTAPTGTGVAGQPYTVTTGAGTNVLVSDAGLIGPAGNQYLEILDNSASASAIFGFGIGPAVTGGDAGVVAVEFVLQEPTTARVASANGSAFNVRLGGNTNGSAGPDLFFTDGAIQYNSGSAVPTLDARYALDVANTFRIVADVNTDTFDLSLNGALIGDDLSFRNALGTLGSATFQTFGGALQTVNLDDITVSDTAAVAAIPEPASISAALGLAGLMLRRTRRA